MGRRIVYQCQLFDVFPAVQRVEVPYWVPYLNMIRGSLWVDGEQAASKQWASSGQAETSSEQTVSKQVVIKSEPTWTAP